jgi:hypothetical protein
VPKQYAMKMSMQSGGRALCFLNLGINGGEWSVSRYSWGRSLSTFRIPNREEAGWASEPVTVSVEIPAPTVRPLPATLLSNRSSHNSATKTFRSVC